MLYLLLHKKKCRNCGKLTHRDVLFCWFCGCSFDYRICASGHKNPAWVQYCLICGKDRSLMSRPHTFPDLSFTRHASKRYTYVPAGGGKVARVVGWMAISAGAAMLCYVAFLIAHGR